MLLVSHFISYCNTSYTPMTVDLRNSSIRPSVSHPDEADRVDPLKDST
jgi:hypothetical protein